MASANSVQLDCDYGDKKLGEQADTCTEANGYVQFDSVHADTETFHVVSWSPEELIATDSERGLSGATSTTLIIHPNSNEIGIIDRTKMDQEQPALTKGMEGKSYGDHFELSGGMYAFATMKWLLQCDEDGIVTDMRLDVAQKHKGDVYDVPNAEWNTGSKAGAKYSAQQCDAACGSRFKSFVDFFQRCSVLAMARLYYFPLVFCSPNLRPE